jgi:hypothetical protein
MVLDVRSRARGARAGAAVHVVPSGAFLAHHAEAGGAGAETRSGYNPMLESFANTRFLVTGGDSWQS